MNQNKYIKIASKISNQLISLWQQGKTHDKTIIELYNELLDSKYYEERHAILSYIPEQLAIKGYDIVDGNHFALRKY